MGASHWKPLLLQFQFREGWEAGLHKKDEDSAIDDEKESEVGKKI